MLSNADKLRNLIGLAQKAGKLKSGDNAVLEALDKHSLKLIVLAEDAAPAVKTALAARNRKNIPVIVFADKAALGSMAGKSPRGMLGITDEGLAAAIKEKYDALD